MDARRGLKIENYPPVRPFSLIGSLSPLVVVPALLPAIALYLAPPNVLDTVLIFREFTEWMASRIPRMSGHASATQIPQVAMLTNCLIVLASAVIALVFLGQSMLNYRYLYCRHIASGPHPMRIYAVAVLGPPLFVGALASVVMLPGDPSWAIGATQDRTFFYGFLAVMTPYSVGLVVGGAPLVLRLFLDAYLFSRPVTMRQRPTR